MLVVPDVAGLKLELHEPRSIVQYCHTVCNANPSGYALHDLMLKFSGTGNNSTGPDDIAKLEWVQKRTAQVSTIYSLITGSLGLLTTIFLGHFSDWKGRKPAAIINSIGNLASIIIFSLIVTLKLPLWVWYLAAIPPGLTGHGFCGFLTLALTMISDLAAGQVEKQNASSDPSLSQLDLGESEPSSETPVVCLSEADPPSAETLQTRTEDANTTRRRLILLGVFDGFVGCMFALAQYAAGESNQVVSCSASSINQNRCITLFDLEG
ncbi:unnamed protein product [Dibothriocephalus latus]|uniref:Uncharacterized protein n=1 Tax=Dibothriocephalus latus TaxID=60516 RepID=A0A3P7NIT6_DIBLA|nr:unnamed protein product [Dibothriocephalus latus]